MQDNDPKHVSRLARVYMEENGINWWCTPAESPGLYPIEICGMSICVLRLNLRIWTDL